MIGAGFGFVLTNANHTATGPGSSVVFIGISTGNGVDTVRLVSVVDQLDELLMIESWFRTRPNDVAFKAETVVGALETLVRDSRYSEPLT